MSDRASRRLFYWGLLVIAVLGTAARLWQINESLWLDELHTSWVISGTVDEIAPRARIGNQSPVYFYLVHLTTRLLGDHELALRLPSLVAGVALIVVVGLVTWRCCAVTWAGWLAAALVAMDHNMIFYAQEARPYALVQLIALVQLVAFWRLQTAYRLRWRLVVVSGWIAMFYLHYTTLLLVTGELAWWLLIQCWQRGRGEYRPRQVVVDVALTLAASAVTWSHLSEIATRRGMWEMFIFQHPPWVAWHWFHGDLYVFNGVVVCGLLAGAEYLWQRRRNVPRRAGEPPAWLAAVPLLVAWAIVPVAIAWSLTATDLARVFFRRYLIGVAAAPMICAGLCIPMCRGARTRAAAAFTIIALAIIGNGLLGQWARDGRLITDRRQDWRGAVAWLNTLRWQEQPVLVRSGLIEADLLTTSTGHPLQQYCLLPVTGLYRIEPPGGLVPLPTTQPGRLSSEVVDLLERQRGGWLVLNLRPAMQAAVQRDLRKSLQRELVFRHERRFGNVLVWQLELPEP